MRKAHIHRFETGDHGTFGTLTSCWRDTSFSCRTIELPWRENQRNISCIPPGTYQCRWIHSNSKGRRYQVMNVPGRGGILIHVANWAGDKAKGLRTDVEGCIGLGTNFEEWSGQQVVVNSKLAVDAFEGLMGEAPFELTITEEYTHETEI